MAKTSVEGSRLVMMVRPNSPRDLSAGSAMFWKVEHVPIKAPELSCSDGHPRSPAYKVLTASASLLRTPLAGASVASSGW
jgi:hypothetical protein